MARFNLNDYATVAQRIDAFHDEYPQGLIQQFIHSYDGEDVVIEARVYRTREDFAAGHFFNGFAQERAGTSNVNTTSFVENCDTSAIGRALANMGFTVKGARPSREEMEKVSRVTSAHEDDIQYIREFIEAGEDVEVEINGDTVSLIDFLMENGDDIKAKPAKAAKAVAIIQSTLVSDDEGDGDPPDVEDEE